MGADRDCVPRPKLLRIALRDSRTDVWDVGSFDGISRPLRNLMGDSIALSLILGFECGSFVVGKPGVDAELDPSEQEARDAQLHKKRRAHPP